MPAAIDDLSRTSANHVKTNLRRHSLMNSVAKNHQEKNEALDRLRDLLVSAPIDLSGISEEIAAIPISNPSCFGSACR